MKPVIFVRMPDDAPTAGQYAVERRGERPLRGRLAETGRRWSRRPYYGHVWLEGRTWRASVAGGRRLAGGWATREQAGLAVLAAGVKA